MVDLLAIVSLCLSQLAIEDQGHHDQIFLWTGEMCMSDASFEIENAANMGKDTVRIGKACNYKSDAIICLFAGLMSDKVSVNS